MNSRNVICVAALSALCILGTAAARAQGTAAAGSASGVKIGVINIQQAIVATAEGKQASAELQSQFAPRQNELEGLNKQINDLQNRLQAGGSTLSDDEKNRLRSQGQRLAQQLERKNNELQEDVNAAQADVIDKIGRKMMDVLDRYARENGYVAILNSTGQSTPVILYASNNIDVTQEIIKLYDQAYPVKSGTPAATKPAATPKPATQPAPKP